MKKYMRNKIRFEFEYMDNIFCHNFHIFKDQVRVSLTMCRFLKIKQNNIHLKMKIIYNMIRTI